MIWFWGLMAVIALALSWGRFAPFYHLFYALPYFSNIRGPMKFMHPFHMALVILFAYGLEGLARLYLGGVPRRPATPLERIWRLVGLVVLGLSALPWLIFNSVRAPFAGYILRMLPPDQHDAGLAATMARFSVNEVGLAVLFLWISLGALLALQAGLFTGRRTSGAGWSWA